MARVALLGGSFNPPHVAHQMLCLWVLSTRHAEQVWWVPCYRHALGKPLAAYEHRREMCLLASGSLPADRVLVSEIEREIGGESRTVFTIRRLLEQYPGHRFSLVIGADILVEKDAWYRFDEVERLVELLVVGRAGFPSPDDSIELAQVSSSEIRRRIARGQPVDHLLPARVAAYIERHRLYREGADGA
jgi:nicotinate-nucleotide adenylyltransferase